MGTFSPNSFSFSYLLVYEYRYWDDIVIADAYIGPQVPPP